MKSIRIITAAFIVTSILSTFTFAQTRRQPTLSDLDISRGLKAALDKGVRAAIQDLGRKNGFLGNDRVRIPLPDGLKKMESTMRFLGQGRRVDEFVGSMNNAAEKAVPEAIDIFVDSLGQMTFTDARNILFSGQDDAATQFFRRTSEERLRVKFRPIVEEFTEQVGVTRQYKSMIGSYGRFGSFFGQDASDIDGYVTQKALDGLFLLVADEEKRIRRDPVGRTTAILRAVFGVLR
jgi:hypothetical protein